jgi:cytochrome P450
MGAPVLCYNPGPDGLPNRMLWHQPGGPESQLVTLPAGAEALLLTSRRTVLPVLARGSMTAGGAHTTGNWLRSELDLLNRDPPGLNAIRRVIDPIAGPGRPSGHLRRLALHLARGLDFRDGPADLVAGVVTPYLTAAVAGDMGVTLADARRVFALTAAAGLVQFGDDGQVASAWEEIYRYCGWLTARKRAYPDGSVIARCAAALRNAGYDGHQIMHVIATLFTGYPSMAPVLTAALYELITTPGLAERYARAGHRQREQMTGRILATRANFATAKVRALASPLTLDGLEVPARFPLVPSVWAALQQDPARWRLAFGAGPHRCPALPVSMQWLVIILAAIAIVHPDLQLAAAPSWPPALLSAPHQLMAWPRSAGAAPRNRARRRTPVSRASPTTGSRRRSSPTPGLISSRTS